MGLERQLMSPAELAAKLAADRHGRPYLLLRDKRGAQRIVDLGDRVQMMIGRLPANDLIIDWDSSVSRAHAILERVGDVWTVLDDGLSRNGSFVNGERLKRRQRLSDGDELRVGNTRITLRVPGPATAETAALSDLAGAVLSAAQHRVLIALCRPLAAQPVGSPASNSEIAAELQVSVETVRTHLKTLFERFAVPNLPQNRKRAELARRALGSGVVRAFEIEP